MTKSKKVIPADRNGMRPIHPGEILKTEFLDEVCVSMNALALHIGVTASRLSEIVAGKRDITADTAYRLSKALDTTPEFWMNLQQSFDLRTLEIKSDFAYNSIKPLWVSHYE